MNGGQFSSDEYLVVTDPDGVNMSQQQYREPPPYPGHSRQLQNTPGKVAHCLLKYMHYMPLFQLSVKCIDCGKTKTPPPFPFFKYLIVICDVDIVCIVW